MVAKHKKKSIVVAVAGNPNCGKSTLINAIAGSKLQVGNWAGVTVEKTTADVVYSGKHITFVDLPGSYSLTPYSQEEIIARDFLVTEKPDVILNVVDSTNLERNLYLTMQLLELDIPIVMALNIYDEAQKKGFVINIPEMEKLLGMDVVPTVSTQKKGIDKILSIIADHSYQPPKVQFYGTDLERAIRMVEENIKKNDSLSGYNSRWLAIKFLEEDQHVLEQTAIVDMSGLTAEAVKHLAKDHDDDILSQVVDERYALASGLYYGVFKTTKKPRIELTEKIDKFILNKYLSIPLFLAFMWLVFKFTFDVGNPFVDWIDGVISGPVSSLFSFLLVSLRAPEWFQSLILDGIVAGVGGVLVFVPIIATMMFCITFLESSGYMARAAFIMDRFMHKIGLHGKAFIPLLLGFGCNVPSIYATRILETDRDKLLTALIVPLVSCGARLPVYVIFTSIFFPDNAATVIISLYILGIVLAILMGMLFNKTLFKAAVPVFIMELPPYRLPSFHNLMVHTWDKVKHYMVKAGTVILAASIVVWFSLNFPYGVEKEDSILAKTGKVIAPVLVPNGFGNWQSSASLLTGLVAKEIVVSTMGEIYSGDEEDAEVSVSAIEQLQGVFTSFFDACRNVVVGIFSNVDITGISSVEDESSSNLKLKVKSSFSPLSSYSFMVFVLLYIPCITVLAAFAHEFKSWKWTGFLIMYLTVLPWFVSMIVYQGGRLLGLG